MTYVTNKTIYFGKSSEYSEYFSIKKNILMYPGDDDRKCLTYSEGIIINYINTF